MAKMENLFHKTWLLGLFGTAATGSTWFGSEFLEGALKDIGLLLTIMIGSTTLYFLIRINRHRDHIKAIEEARAETKLCEECRNGEKPVRCPIPPEARPNDCPLTKKLDKLNKIIAEATAIYKEETTTKK